MADAIFVTIPSGATGLSGAIDLQDARAARLMMPATWVAAALTFQTSMDGVNYSNLYDVNGEYTISTAVVAASREIILPLQDFIGIRFLKIRSGTSGTPVDQTANRSIGIQRVPGLY